MHSGTGGPRGSAQRGATPTPWPLAPPHPSLGQSPPVLGRHFLSSPGRVRSVQWGGLGSALPLIWPSEPSRGRWFGPQRMGLYRLRAVTSLAVPGPWTLRSGCWATVPSAPPLCAGWGGASGVSGLLAAAQPPRATGSCPRIYAAPAAVSLTVPGLPDPSWVRFLTLRGFAAQSQACPGSRGLGAYPQEFRACLLPSLNLGKLTHLTRPQFHKSLSSWSWKETSGSFS